MQFRWIMIAFLKGYRKKRAEKEKPEDFCFKEEKKNGEGKGGKIMEKGQI